VKADDLYETIHSFVKENKVIVSEYDDMVKVILRMITSGYCFSVERDLLRDAMESLTYFYSPDDDMNRDRIVCQLDDDGDSDSDDDGEPNPMEGLMRMMGGMGGMGGLGGLGGPGPGPCADGPCADGDTCDRGGCPGRSECDKEECSTQVPEELLEEVIPSQGDEEVIPKKEANEGDDADDVD